MTEQAGSCLYERNSIMGGKLQDGTGGRLVWFQPSPHPG